MKIRDVRMISRLRLLVKNEVKMIGNGIRGGDEGKDKRDKGVSHSTSLSPQEPHAPVKSRPHTKGFS